MRNGKILFWKTLAEALVLALVFGTAVLSTACSFDDISEPAAPDGSGQIENRREALALMHAADSHETSEAELRNEVLALLQTDAVSRGAGGSGSASVINGVRKFTSTIENGFSSYPANARSAAAEEEASEIAFYLFSLENQTAQTEGFALACGDNRVGTVLALVEDGAYDDMDNPFLSVFYPNLGDYIVNTIEEYNSITGEEIAAAVEQYSVVDADGSRTAFGTVHDYDTPFAPLTAATQWNQASPYWDVINSVAGRSSDKWNTGCVATAIAQIMACHGWPQKPASSLRRPNASSYTTSFTDPYSKTTKSFSGVVYEWAAMKSQVSASSLSNNIKTEIGVLMLEIGGKVNMTYETGKSGASSENVPGAFTAMGYKQATLTDYNIGNIVASIDQKKPVYVSASDTKTTKKEYQWWDIFHWFPKTIITYEGHAWVIDDYRIRTMVVPVLLTVGPASIPMSVYQVHCNLGWGGGSNGWYQSGIFDTRSGAGPVESDRSVEGQKRNYQLRQQIIPYITPNK